MNKRSGRLALVALLAVALGLAALIVVFLFSRGESDLQVAGKFMDALSKHDADKLTALTYMDGETPESIHKAWEKTINYTRYYRFGWTLDRATQTSPDASAVLIKLIPDLNRPTTYERKGEIPMRKVNGKWLVDIRACSSGIYPSLPQ